MNDAIINIVSATQSGEYRIRLVFSDETTQEVDFKEFLLHAIHPDIRAYLEPGRFAGFRVEYGDLVWDDYQLCFPIIDLYHNMITHRSPMNVVA
ncbi:DUF2442 domain-containing protein [Methylomonas sp. LL1]|uniref:DUF2442 domain-containing protein n=1 Tax=Methylomonas sp. LL1 TaxID=2785785 RepID=UPI0018C40549|nr:DUF2442 domain-containing protein [Methylomonas sp. LL1]QPK64924.1 DUF2442 domain-containing protein [Methylomonas sp. LL1]